MEGPSTDLTPEESAKVIGIAYARASADGVLEDGELAEEILLASQELQRAKRKARFQWLLKNPPNLLRPTGVEMGDAAVVDAWNHERVAAHGASCAETLRKNVLFINGAAAVLTVALAGATGGGAGGAGAAVKALMPLAGQALTMLKAA